MDSIGSTSDKETPLEKRDSPAPRAGCVLAVDDQALFRSALRHLVEATSSLVVVGEAESGEAAVVFVQELEPDLVLMDVRMPGLGGIGATRAIKEIRPETVVLLVSTTRPDELPREAGECLADAIVWKGELRPKLLDAIWRRHERRANRRPAGRPQRNI